MMKTLHYLSGISVFIFLFTFSLTPAFAGMGGGSGGGSGGGEMGGSGGGMDPQGGARGSRDMPSAESSRGVGSMPMVSTGSMGGGSAKIDLKPVRYREGKLEVKFSANTHSVSLSRYDLMERTTLEYGGRTFSPVRSDRMRGHHAGGRMVFEIGEEPDSFRIIIRGVPTVEERVYSW